MCSRNINQFLTGSIVALITPFTNSNEIDYEDLQQLIEYHIESGTKSIVIAGTTGEASTLSSEEKLELFKKSIEYAKGRIAIIAGVGSNNTAEVIKNIQTLNSIDLDGYLSVSPYYNKPTQEGLYQHFKAIANATKKPIILYNVPSRTQSDILPITINRLSHIDNIVAVKEATGDLRRVESIIRDSAEGFIYLSGDDLTAIESIYLGGSGVISVSANIIAQEWAEIIDKALNNQRAEVYKLNKQFYSLHRVLFIESNPSPVKWIAKQFGLIKEDNLRLPLLKVSVEAQDKLTDELKKANLSIK